MQPQYIRRGLERVDFVPIYNPAAAFLGISVMRGAWRMCCILTILNGFLENRKNCLRFGRRDPTQNNGCNHSGWRGNYNSGVVQNVVYNRTSMHVINCWEPLVDSWIGEQ